MTPTCAFYCVADARYFIGLVATINSLRLVGQDEPIRVLDCGLTRDQVELLANEAIVFPTPDDRSPYLLGHLLPLAEPADTMVLLDADIVFTRPLKPVLELAQGAMIVAFEDALCDRFSPEWADLLGYQSLEPHRYVNAGFLVLPREPGISVLEELRDATRHIDLSRSMASLGGSRDYPFYFLDQDIVNAIFAARIAPLDGLVTLDHRLAPHPPFVGLRLRDERRLDCAYEDGSEPFLLHHILAKPWLTTMIPNLFSRLLPRLLLAPDLPLRVPDEMLPVRLRNGSLGSAERARTAVLAQWRRSRRRLGLRRRSA